MALELVEKKTEEAYHTYATSSASSTTTWGQQLASLQTAYNALTDTEKEKSVLNAGGIMARYSQAGKYFASSLKGAKDGAVLNYYDIVNAEYYQVVLDGNGVDVRNISSNAHAAAITLNGFNII